MTASVPPGPETPIATCAYHPGRPAGVRCQRCGNPICAECMVEAPVGFQCPRCLAEGLARTRQVEGPYGGRRSANPTLTTMALVVANAAVWLGIVVSGGGGARLTSVLALTPGGLCELGAGLFVGVDAAGCRAAGGTFLPGVFDGAWWQVLTSAFTHVSVAHIAMNMLALWILGPQVERVLGRSRFLAVYLVAALAASAFVMWLSDPTTQTLGASGAISGLMGALLVLVVRIGGDLRWILTWIGINVVITVLGSAWISWQGHLGGFVGGTAATLAVVGLARARTPQWLAVSGVGVLALAATAARVLTAG